MPGHRFFTPFQHADKTFILKDPDEFQHLSRVLRLKKGDALELVNGQGGLVRGVIDGIGRDSASITAQEALSVPRPPGPSVTLACAVPKKMKFESIIEKCTELGVDRIIPLVTARTEFFRGAEKAEKRSARFLRVVVNAAKQSKRLWFPEISAPLPFAEAVQDVSGPQAALFIPWLEGERVPLLRALEGKGRMKQIVFFIGPEGDFTPAEVALAREAGAVPVSLGENVLKVDTAAMAVVACAVSVREGS